MFRFVARTLITAFTFAFILPQIPGIDFYGNFGTAVVASVLFGVLGSLVDFAAVTLTALFTITTLGLALLVLIPLWVFGFWILPAVSLKLLADVMPQYLKVAGWIPAIEGALVLLVIGSVTSFLFKKK